MTPQDHFGVPPPPHTPLAQGNQESSLSKSAKSSTPTNPSPSSSHIPAPPSIPHPSHGSGTGGGGSGRSARKVILSQDGSSIAIPVSNNENSIAQTDIMLHKIRFNDTDPTHRDFTTIPPPSVIQYSNNGRAEADMKILIENANKVAIVYVTSLL